MNYLIQNINIIILIVLFLQNFVQNNFVYVYFAYTLYTYDGFAFDRV